MACLSQNLVCIIYFGIPCWETWIDPSTMINNLQQLCTVHQTISYSQTHLQLRVESRSVTNDDKILDCDQYEFEIGLFKTCYQASKHWLCSKGGSELLCRLQDWIELQSAKILSSLSAGTPFSLSQRSSDWVFDGLIPERSSNVLIAGWPNLCFHCKHD